MKRIVVGITGASGGIFGVRLLHILRAVPGVETHLIVSPSARLTLSGECDLSPADLAGVAHVVHHHADVAAPISSGSFRTHGMMVVPCSMKTMSNIATGNTGDLITRAADVVMKERGRLLLAVRETPLHSGHLANMLTLAQRGVTIFPPVPAFYHRPTDIQQIVDHSCMRMLDQMDIPTDAAPRWGEDISLRSRQTGSRQATGVEPRGQ